MSELQQTRVAGALDAAQLEPLAELELSVGASIGRYIVLEQLGAGAMGVVLAVYDPALERKIALKLIKPAGTIASASERLRREAQALARLNHVNVVTVYDVGIHEGQIFVAMEYVAGQTLRAWLEEREAPRAWQEVVQVLSAAGRGLAAAHGEGLVHRDFKPENVMVGEDGRVRVMDFGLARAGGEATTLDADVDTTGEELPVDSERSFDLRLTRTGSNVGTPAYMAPEQFEGKPAGAHSDQFAFCVALYEALYGRRPFVGADFRELARAVLRGQLQPPPSGTRVPAWIAKVVLQGLAPEPRERHPSMAALLDALAEDPRLPYRRAGLGLALVGAFAGAVWLGGALRSPAAAPCTDMGAALIEVWDAPRRAALAQAFEATGRGYASETQALVEAGLDAYAQAWVEARTEACEATQAGTQSGELLDRRIACLDRRLDRVGALVRELSQADAAMLERASDAVEQLPSLAPCADFDALMAAQAPPEDPALAAQVERVDARLEQLRAKLSLAAYDETEALAEQLVDDARALDYPPLLVRAELEQGKLHGRLDQYDAARASYAQAYGRALDLRMLPEALDASLLQMALHARSLEQPEEAERWGRVAEALSALDGGLDGRARYLRQRADLRQQGGDYDGALAALDEARALIEEAHGPEHYNLIVLLAEAGSISLNAGDFERGQAQLERALAVRERVLGPAHPDVAVTLGNLGIIAFRLEQFAEARAKLERAREIFERSYGPASFQVSRTLDALGSVALLEGDYASARTYYLEAKALLEQLVEPEHPKIAALIANLGEVARNEGQFQDAYEAQLEARALIEARHGQHHPSLVLIQTELGKDLLGLGRPADALAELERALALNAEFGEEPRARDDIRFTLARALRAAGVEPERARELGRLVRDSYREQSDAEGLAELEAWLAEPGAG